MNKIIIILLVFIPNIVFSQINTTLVQYNQSINKDSLEKTVLKLQSYGTRFCFKPNRREIAQDLKQQLQAYGFESKLDSFYIDNFEYPFHSGQLNSGWQYNVVGQIRGSIAPDTFFVVGGHYDAISFLEHQTPAFDTTPGADDNGSGIAAIMEIARLFHKHNIIPTKTLRLELYGAEEIGLKGSFVAIERSSNLLTEHIAGMMCLDMIGNKTDTSSEDIIQFVEYDNSIALTQFCQTTAYLYTNLMPIPNTSILGSSDSYSYYQWGRKTIFLTEGQFSPFYHSPQDLSSNINYNYLSKTTKLAFSIAYLATTTNNYYPLSLPHNSTLTQPQLHLNSHPVKNNIELTYTNPKAENPIFQIINQMGIIQKTSHLLPYKTSTNQYQIPVRNLNTGIYILRIANQTQKIIIVK